MVQMKVAAATVPAGSELTVNAVFAAAGAPMTQV
jgi:hypothetical protein